MGKGDDPNCAVGGAALSAVDAEDVKAAAAVERILDGVRRMRMPSVWKVGGVKRDELLGRAPKDVDVMVAGVTYEELLALAKEHCTVVKPLESNGQLLGVRVVADWTDGEEVEIALARTEVSTGPGRHEFDITPLDVPESMRDLGVHARAENDELIQQVIIDAGRRDLTCNAIAENILTGQVIDPYNGAQDTLYGVIRAVSPDTFRDDPLRVFRVLSRMAKDDSFPEPQTEEMIREWSRLLRVQDLPDPPTADPNGEPLSQDRIRDELKKVLGWGDEPAKHSAHAMRHAIQWGLLQRVIPEFEASVGYDQNNEHHDLPLHEHHLHALAHADEIQASPIVKTAALLHDIYKPATAKPGRNANTSYMALPLRDADGNIHPDWVKLAEDAKEAFETGRMPDVKREPEGGWTPENVRRLLFHGAATKADSKAAAAVERIAPEHLFDHAELAYRRLDHILGQERLRFDVDAARQIRHVVRHHMFKEDENFAQRPAERKDVIARRFLAAHGPQNAFLLCQFRRCDRAGKSAGANDPSVFEDITAFEQALRRNLHHPLTLKQLHVNGNDLRDLGLKPGPEHREILTDLLSRVVGDPTLNDPQWLRAQAAAAVLKATEGKAEKAREVVQEARKAKEALKAQRREAFLAAGGVIPDNKKK